VHHKVIHWTVSTGTTLSYET